MNKMKKYWYTMMLIGSLIAVKGSSLIPRIWELETFSGEHKIERLAETEDKQPSNIPLSSDSISESAASKGRNSYSKVPLSRVLPCGTAH